MHTPTQLHGGTSQPGRVPVRLASMGGFRSSVCPFAPPWPLQAPMMVVAVGMKGATGSLTALARNVELLAPLFLSTRTG